MPFDISIWELLIVAIIGVIVLGPERLPVVARTLGLWIGKARQAFSSVKNEIDRELQIEELRRQIKEQQEKVENLAAQGQQSIDEFARQTQQQIEETRSDFESQKQQQQNTIAPSESDSKK